ncbi:hypothetical protein F4861DRAFT_539129 [Xylaria intraflava]|nr:hypothetical protein F4861DRAFT_539129 [Xylaria intraflava]
MASPFASRASNHRRTVGTPWPLTPKSSSRADDPITASGFGRLRSSRLQGPLRNARPTFGQPDLGAPTSVAIEKNEEITKDAFLYDDDKSDAGALRNPIARNEISPGRGDAVLMYYLDNGRTIRPSRRLPEKDPQIFRPLETSLGGTGVFETPTDSISQSVFPRWFDGTEKTRVAPLPPPPLTEDELLYDWRSQQASNEPTPYPGRYLNPNNQPVSEKSIVEDLDFAPTWTPPRSSYMQTSRILEDADDAPDEYFPSHRDPHPNPNDERDNEKSMASSYIQYLRSFRSPSDTRLSQKPRHGAVKKTAGLGGLGLSTISRDNTADESSRISASFAFLGSKLAKARLENGKAAVVKAKYVTPVQPATFVCDECEKLFTRRDNLRIHKKKWHPNLVGKFICVDPHVRGIPTNLQVTRPLAKCKACREQKKYGAYYNAAAHLRRVHFREKPSRSGNNRGKNAGDWPAIQELRDCWMREVLAPRDEQQSEVDDMSDLE